MLSDITLGQYFPEESFIHKLDPRSKILMIIAYIASIFIINNFTGYLILGVFLIVCIVNTRIPVKFMIKGLKPVVFFIVLTGFFNLFLTTTGKIYWKWRF